MEQNNDVMIHIQLPIDAKGGIENSDSHLGGLWVYENKSFLTHKLVAIVIGVVRWNIHTKTFRRKGVMHQN